MAIAENERDVKVWGICSERHWFFYSSTITLRIGWEILETTYSWNHVVDNRTEAEAITNTHTHTHRNTRTHQWGKWKIFRHGRKLVPRLVCDPLKVESTDLPKEASGRGWRIYAIVNDTGTFGGWIQNHPSKSNDVKPENMNRGCCAHDLSVVGAPDDIIWCKCIILSWNLTIILYCFC